MAQIIEQQGSPIGRIGKGIGKGLAEQIPKEIDRYRLSSGLEKFAKESSGKSPFQQAVDFYKIPGATAEMGYTLFPLLQQEAKRNADLNIPGEDKSVNRKPGNLKVTARVIPEDELRQLEQGEKSPKHSLKKLSDTQSQLHPIQRMSEYDMLRTAKELSSQNPQMWPTPEDALPIVREEEAIRLANLNEERNIANTADALNRTIRSDLEKAWNKDNTFKGIPGTVQSAMLRNIESKLADPNNTKSESDLIEEGRQAGKEVAQASTNLEAAGKQKWLTQPKEIRRVTKDIRKAFEKAGALEEYQDLLSSNLDLSPHIAADFAYPANKQQKDFFSNIKNPEYEPLASTFFDIYNPEQVKNYSINAADDILEQGLISGEDSILSMAAQLKKKNLDPQIFINRLRQNAEMGLWEPNERQQRELQKVVSGIPSLGDFYISLMLDEDELVE